MAIFTMYTPMEKSHLKSQLYWSGRNKCFNFSSRSLLSFFFTWLHLIGLFFCWLRFVGFGFFERYVGITFLGEKRHFV